MNFDGTFSSSKASALEASRIYNQYRRIISQFINKLLGNDGKQITFSVNERALLETDKEYMMLKDAYMSGLISKDVLLETILGRK